MRRKLLIFCLVLLSLICLISSEIAECTLSYSKNTNPDPQCCDNPPSNPPWLSLTGSISINYLDILWLADDDNCYVSNQKTAWSVRVTGGVAKKLDYYPDDYGCQDGNSTPLTGTALPYTDYADGSREFHWEFIPQPDWQVVALQMVTPKAGEFAEDIQVQAEFACHDTLKVVGSTAIIGNVRIGNAEEDTIEIREIIIYPHEMSIDTTGSHTLDAPGTWSRQFVWENPYGQPQPLGGVSWTLEEGNGLKAGDVFSLQLTMSAPPLSTFSLYAFDSESAVYYHFKMRTESAAIPTLTEWGLIIFAVVLLGFITLVFFRRRKTLALRV